MVDVQQRPAGAESVEGAPRLRDRRELIPAIGLKEYWYPAVEARKVKSKPYGLKICGVDLVFFKGEKGEVKCLWNVCPHRGGSLMHGDCHYPGTISCPYHGWTFDGDGNVLAVLPEGPGSQVPGKVRARAYPTVTLKGMVFVWMGDGDPVPPEEDIPPELFDPTCIILFAKEDWDINWRLMNENGGDAHAPYVHRNSARALLQPLPQTGPSSGKVKTFPGRSTVIGRDPSRRQFRFDIPGLGPWPKHNYRRWWTWTARWAAKRQRSKPPFKTHEEWDTGHHLPSYTRINHNIYIHTRCAVPVTENSLRNIYLKAIRPASKPHEWYIRLQWKLWGRWSQVTNFQMQDYRAVKGQRYDTREYPSATDSEVIAWRRLIADTARGLPRTDAAGVETASEQFARERREAFGVGED